MGVIMASVWRNWALALLLTHGLQASLTWLLYLWNKDDQSHQERLEQVALCKVESLAFDDIFVFIVHLDVSIEKGQKQQVRKKARCFLRTPRWQYVLCQWWQENVYFLLHWKIIHPSNLCSTIFNWSPFCLQGKKITFVPGYSQLFRVHIPKMNDNSHP